MLAKLMRYDFLAIARVGVVVLIVLAIAAVVACTAGAVLNHVVNLQATFWEQPNYYDSPEYQRLSTIFALASFINFVAVGTIWGCVVAMFMTCLHRYYTNLHTDEGYLTMTLPVSSTQIVGSKILVSLIWTFVTMLLALAAVQVLEMITSGSDYDINYGFVANMLQINSGNISGDLRFANVVLGILALLITMALSFLACFSALNLGADVSTRHKLAAGIGFMVLFYLAYNVVTGFVSVLIAASVGIFSEEFITIFPMMRHALLLADVGLAVGFFFLCSYLLKRHTNL